MNAIEVKNLFLSNSKFVLDVPSLKIKKGDFVGVFGSNGSGKTTFIECIMGIRHFEKGEVIINSECQTPFSAVLQETNIWDAKVKHILDFFWKLNDSIDEYDELFNYFEIAEFIGVKFSKLSFGQKQRFRIFLCLAKKADMYFFDEVDTGLSTYWRTKTMDYINQIKTSKTIIMISHDLPEMQNYTNIIIKMDKGKIVSI